jgi:ABC-type amino acid transport substrate-binding protein
MAMMKTLTIAWLRCRPPSPPRRFLLTLTLACGVALAAAQPSPVPPADIARILARGTLVVAMRSVDTPPFFYVRDGQLQGFEVDMARALARELGVALRVDRSPASFNDVVDAVARGQADLGLSKLSRTLARARTVRFSDPYLSLRHALLLHRESLARLARGRPVPQVLRNFEGSIGVIAKSSFADFARRHFPRATVREFATWEAVVQAVSRGDVMAAYRDEFEIKGVLRSDPAAALALRTVTLDDLDDTLAMVVHPADVHWLAFVNQFLAQRGRGERQDIDSLLRALDEPAGPVIKSVGSAQGPKP